MKLPSLDSLVNKSTSAFTRFPLAILFAFLGACYAVSILNLPYEVQETHHYYWNLLMSCYLGMLLFVAVTVYGERVKMNLTTRALVQVAGIVIIILHYVSLPDHFMAISVIRFALFSVGLHLLIAFAPFTGGGELNGFWQYNKIIFLRILTAALYSSVLYIGLSLALLAINQLFKADINGKVYGDLFFFIAGVFNTWFFLAGFPGNYAGLESQTDYPKGLKIFTQYVLLPLITVYLLILYAYMFKIIFTTQWPVGWVSYLVVGFSIAGILSLLLIHPVRNDEHNKWMLVYSRFFYFAIFPLIVLFFLAIKRRISDYGITENRYFVLVLALWLLFIAIYFLSSKAKNIKLIPISLCFIAFLGSFGPWGAFRISLNSQKKHLTELLEKNRMMAEGKIIKSVPEISFDDHKEISSVVEYLVEVHGYESLQPFFTQNLDSLMKTDSTMNLRYSYEQVNKILALMKVTYISGSQAQEEKYVDFRSESSGTFNISGYDYFISDFSVSDYDSKDTVCASYQVGGHAVSICYDTKGNLLTLSDHVDSALVFNVGSLVSSLKEQKNANYNTLKAGEMTMNASNDRLAARMIFKIIYGEQKQDTFKLVRIQADVMIQLKHEKENEVGERNQ